MNVSILSETAAWGGGEVHTAALADTLAARGHEVLIVPLLRDVFSDVALRDSARFRVRPTHLAKPVKRLSLAECQELVDSLPDGICVLARWGLGVGSLRLDLAARLRFERYVAIEHSTAALPPRTYRRHLGGLLPGLGLWWFRGRLLWFLRSCLTSLVVCISHDARRRLIHDFHVPPHKVVTVHNGIDADRFRPDPACRAAARRAWGVPEDALVLGAVGRLSREKGYDIALASFAQLLARHPGRDLRLVLVGDGPERPSLEKGAQARGISERVVFAGFSAQPWQAYPGIDVFVMPSRDEALPLALLEAMACGCPPVAMASGGVLEVLSDPSLGWLVPAEDTQAFTAALDEAITAGPERRAALGRAGRAHVVAHFDARRQYAVLADLIEEGTSPAA
jgi:glycosyltransferase involved in cell wall biosynthesis